MAEAAAKFAASAVEKEFDEIKEWSDEEHQRYLDSLGDAEEHPLFRDVSEDEASDFGEAMRAADVADDEDALQQATKRKDRGNAAFKKGPDFFGNALRHYKDAIGLLKSVEEDTGVQGPSVTLASVVHANIAAVYMKRRVWHRAIGAAEESLRLNPGNAKASFRLATCFLELARFDRAAGACRAALAAEGGAGSAALAGLLAKAEEGTARSARRRAAVDARRREREGLVAAAREACRARGIRIGRPMLRDMARTSDTLPSVDADGVMQWPVTLLFPAKAMSELVQSCPETASMGDLVATLLPATRGAAPPAPWDPEAAYSADAVTVLYRANETPEVDASLLWAEQLGEDADDDDLSKPAAPPLEASRPWIIVPPSAPLALVLMQPDCVLPGMPALYVVPAGSEAEAALRRESGGTLRTLRVPELPSM